MTDNTYIIAILALSLLLAIAFCVYLIIKLEDAQHENDKLHLQISRLKQTKVDLRGAVLHEISKDNYPTFPCWCYHQLLGFALYQEDPASLNLHPHSLVDSNVTHWLDDRKV